MQLSILTVPNPILRQKSRQVLRSAATSDRRSRALITLSVVEVQSRDKKVLEFIKNLEETLLKKKNPPGVGLSAPQVGKSWRIFSTLLPKDKPVLQTYINPTIVSASKKLTLGNEKLKAISYKLKADREPILEGCLSIPGIYGPVYRHEWVKLEYQLLNAKSSKQNALSVKPYALSKKVSTFSGFPARVLQHELDHLDGILFTDRALQQKLPLYEDRRGKLTEIQLA